MKERLRKDIRHARIDRAEPAAIHDDSGHLWAVSYSDFLMVLLCFFILFFSVNDEKKKDIIQKIFADAKTVESSGAAVTGAGNATGGRAGGPGRFPAADLEKSLGSFSFSVAQDEAGLLVHFPDDLYAAGSYEIHETQARLLESFLAKVSPYRDLISLTFVGHADAAAVRRGSKRKYTDNFDLSSLRATRALQFAARGGFPEDQMAAKGTSKNGRSSRTISILIKPKSETL